MTFRALFAVCAIACSCQPDDTASLGRFHGTATRGASTCGAQSGEFDQRIEYDVELKTRTGLLVWTPTGAQPTNGLWSPSLRSFRIALEVDSALWPADRRREIVGCTVRRTDVMEGTITMDDPDAGATDAGLDAGNAPLKDGLRRSRGGKTRLSEGRRTAAESYSPEPN